MPKFPRENAAKAAFADTPHYFSTHDFSQIASFLNDLQSLQATLPQPFIIVIFSGVLCHLVATGSRQSLQLISILAVNYPLI